MLNENSKGLLISLFLNSGVITFLALLNFAEVIYHTAPVFEDHSTIKYTILLTAENSMIPI